MPSMCTGPGVSSRTLLAIRNASTTPWQYPRGVILTTSIRPESTRRDLVALSARDAGRHTCRGFAFGTDRSGPRGPAAPVRRADPRPDLYLDRVAGGQQRLWRHGGHIGRADIAWSDVRVLYDRHNRRVASSHAALVGLLHGAREPLRRQPRQDAVRALRGTRGCRPARGWRGVHAQPATADRCPAGFLPARRAFGARVGQQPADGRPMGGYRRRGPRRNSGRRSACDSPAIAVDDQGGWNRTGRGPALHGRVQLLRPPTACHQNNVQPSLT